jgi:hypothetical protein
VKGGRHEAGAPFRTCQVQKTGYFFFAAFFFVAFFFAAFFLAAIEDHLLQIYCLGCAFVLPVLAARTGSEDPAFLAGLDNSTSCAITPEERPTNDATRCKTTKDDP